MDRVCVGPMTPTLFSLGSGTRSGMRQSGNWYAVAALTRTFCAGLLPVFSISAVSSAYAPGITGRTSLTCLTVSQARYACSFDCCIVSHCFPERSEEHTSELQSHSDLVCRLLLEK